jgi:hypothetical protein
LSWSQTHHRTRNSRRSPARAGRRGAKRSGSWACVRRTRPGGVRRPHGRSTAALRRQPKATQRRSRRRCTRPPPARAGKLRESHHSRARSHTRPRRRRPTRSPVARRCVSGVQRLRGGFRTRSAAREWVDRKVDEVEALRTGDRPVATEIPTVSEFLVVFSRPMRLIPRPPTSFATS